MIKPMCMVSSNSKTNGDVLMMTKKSPFTHFIYISEKTENVEITNTFFISKLHNDLPLYIKFLWVFHIFILRKTHVHLVGVLRK